VSADTDGYVELEAVKPKPGGKLSMKMTVNGQFAYEDSDMLQEELKPNYAFFVQAHFDDYATAKLGQD
jgi:hypothetical protein